MTASVAGWRGPAARTADEPSVPDLDEPPPSTSLLPLGPRLSSSEGGRSLEVATGEGLGDVGMRPPVLLTATLGLREPTTDCGVGIPLADPARELSPCSVGTCNSDSFMIAGRCLTASS